MEPVTIEVERIDPAEALRRIRAAVIETRSRTNNRTAQDAYSHVLAIIDHRWPNGAQA